MKLRRSVVNRSKKFWVEIMANTNAKTFKITLVKSVFGQLKSHKACVHGLGLRRIRDSAVVIDTPATRGMVNAAQHLLKVEEA